VVLEPVAIQPGAGRPSADGEASAAAEEAEDPRARGPGEASRSARSEPRRVSAEGRIAPPRRDRPAPLRLRCRRWPRGRGGGVPRAARARRSAESIAGSSAPPPRANGCARGAGCGARASLIPSHGLASSIVAASAIHAAGRAGTRPDSLLVRAPGTPRGSCLVQGSRRGSGGHRRGSVAIARPPEPACGIVLEPSELVRRLADLVASEGLAFRTRGRDREGSSSMSRLEPIEGLTISPGRRSTWYSTSTTSPPRPRRRRSPSDALEKRMSSTA
jgi:hypothetical protein